MSASRHGWGGRQSRQLALTRQPRIGGDRPRDSDDDDYSDSSGGGYGRAGANETARDKQLAARAAAEDE